jgi:hypothetical protein
MAYHAGIAQRHAVGDGATACDGTARNTGPTTRIATDRGVGEAGVEAVYAIAASCMLRGMKGMKASATKATSGVKATATMETATAVEPPTMETTTTVEAATTTVETAATSMAAPTTARSGDVHKYQPHDCAREDASERQPKQLIVRSSQHSFLHLNCRRLGRPAAPEAP